MKLIRTIRLDPSDTFVFERAAEPGEWAVSGAFVFWNADVGEAGRQGALGVPRRVPRHRVARLVHAGADRRGERRLIMPPPSNASRSSWSRTSARPTSRPRAPRREEEVAFAASLAQPPGRHADRRAPHLRGRRGARGVPHAASARRPQADARVLVPRGRRRGRAGRRGRPGRAGKGEADEGLLALLRAPSARPRRGRRARGHRRFPEGLSGAARADAAAGGLRGREDPACRPDGRSAPRRFRPTRSPRSRTPTRARTGR